jgi:phosphoribosylanthranilate isomerase
VREEDNAISLERFYGDISSGIESYSAQQRDERMFESFYPYN